MEGKSINQCLLAAAMCCCGINGLLAGSLTWPEQSKELVLDESRTIEFQFPVENRTAEVIEIGRTQVSCGCVVVEPSARVLRPGEKSELKGTYRPDAGKRRQAATIVVEDSTGTQTVLRLRVKKPEGFSMDKDLLVWRAGDQPEDKVIRIVVDDPAVTKFTAAKAMDGQFAARIETKADGRLVLLHVQPLDGKSARQGVVKLTVEDPDSRAVFVKVRVEEE